MMCKWHRHILLLTAVAFPLPALYGQESKRDTTAALQGHIHAPGQHYYTTQIHSDSMVTPINYRDLDEKSEAFYDTLKYRDYKNPLMRLAMRYLIRSRSSSDEGLPSTELKKNKDYFERFRGKTITGVKITQANVFSPRDSSEKVKWFQRFIDNVHIQTKEKQLVQDLLFKAGDELDPHAMGINEELLRSRPYLSTAYFVVMPDPADSTGVIVNVFARDSWSISGDISFGDRKEISVFDRNFLGITDELRLSYTCDKFFIEEPAFEIDYTLRNLLGTFSDVDLKIGVGTGQNVALFRFERPFILPSDRAMGFSVGHVYEKEGQRLKDTSFYVDRFDMDIWWGKSWELSKRNGTNLYASILYGKQHYNVRPEVDTYVNPYYHDYQELMVSLGIGRKNFFQGNMIYGYGRTEDIPYGFRSEVIFGRRWDDMLGVRDYIGARLFWADLLGNHYLEAGIAGGSFINNAGKAEQGVLNTSIKYFTPLVRVNTGYVRQFISLSTTLGFKRLEGEREALRYEERNEIRGLKAKANMLGYNRLTLTSETVVFTPIFLYHFRFAFFGFGDMGWLGDRDNVFHNKFTGSIGLGVRIKNERLIFNNIQLRVGIAFNRPDDVRYSHFGISSEPRYEDFNFTPGRPQVVKYE